MRNPITENPHGLKEETTNWLLSQLAGPASEEINDIINSSIDRTYIPYVFENTKDRIPQDQLWKAMNEYWRRVEKQPNDPAAVLVAWDMNENYYEEFYKEDERARYLYFPSLENNAGEKGGALFIIYIRGDIPHSIVATAFSSKAGIWSGDSLCVVLATVTRTINLCFLVVVEQIELEIKRRNQTFGFVH